MSHWCSIRRKADKIHPNLFRYVKQKFHVFLRLPNSEMNLPLSHCPTNGERSSTVEVKSKKDRHGFCSVIDQPPNLKTTLPRLVAHAPLPDLRPLFDKEFIILFLNLVVII